MWHCSHFVPKTFRIIFSKGAKMSYYTLYWRKDSGRYYYRTNNQDGTRSTGRSTGQKTKAKANDYCQRLIAEGRLWEGDESTFGAYIKIYHWFQPGKCQYLADRQTGGTKDKPGISDSYIRRLKLDLDQYLLPYFEKLKMRKIGPETIRSFRVWLQNERGLSNKSINNAMGTLKIIIGWALDNNLIYQDPFRGIKQLKTDDNPRDAFLSCEIRRILRLKWNNQMLWLYTLTSAVTGMRLCEVGAIRDQTIFLDFIDVQDQWKKKLAPIKNKEKRKIPLPSRLRELLRQYTKKDSFTFLDGNAPTPYYIPARMVIKMMPPDVMAQKKERKLSFHSLRHFFNTWLLSQNVPLTKVQAVMGHSVGKGSMTDTYTHWQASDFPEVYAAQEKLLDLLLTDNINIDNIH
jgi:integrase